ncbi:hypothetical protein [Leptospirillum ferriphilum]|uniref:hypothetical protein n=1 Tax=Leptospirillum ferriphilum TaxID=178606 RepID=UPI000A48A8DF|nr:hypothetical protein [Leptospirillum ferriphilum]
MDPAQLALTIQVLEEFMADPDSAVPPGTRQALLDLVEFVKFMHMAGGPEMPTGPFPGV